MQEFVLDANVVISFLLQEGSTYADGVFKEHLARGAMAHVHLKPVLRQGSCDCDGSRLFRGSFYHTPVTFPPFAPTR